MAKMEEKKEKKPRLKGFAAFIGNLVNMAMQKEECRIYVKGLKTRVLLSNEEDKKWAALITVIRDNVTVEGIEKGDKFKIKKRANDLKAWSCWEFSNLQTMLNAGEWGTGKWIRKMAGKSVKGASQIAIIGRILSYARSS